MNAIFPNGFMNAALKRLRRGFVENIVLSMLEKYLSKPGVDVLVEKVYRHYCQQRTETEGEDFYLRSEIIKAETKIQNLLSL